jgi:hypothetical protein
MQEIDVRSIIKEDKKYWVKKTAERVQDSRNKDRLITVEKYYVGVTTEDVTDSKNVQFRECDEIEALVFENKYRKPESKMDFRCPACGSEEMVYSANIKVAVSTEVFDYKGRLMQPIPKSMTPAFGCAICKRFFIPAMQI